VGASQLDGLDRLGPLNCAQRMDPARKRRIRLVVALTAALLLAGALAYTSFSASSEAVDPSKLLASADAGASYKLTGKVVDGSIRKEGNATLFRVRDRDGRASVPVRYVGTVPDTFRDGREVIVTVRKQGAAFEGDRDSLVTKCPSKFTDKKPTRS
jgi:cytochrome c-type biogenesis protein CcmE